MNIDLSFRDLPITSYDDLNRAIRMLLGSHPLLAPLTDHIPACEIDYYSLFGTGDEPDNDGDLMFKNGDWMDAVTHTVNVLVSFNNDRWNFAPGGAPPRIDPNDARLVAKCLYTAEGLKDAQVTSNGLAVLCSGEGTFAMPTRWSVSIWKTPKEYYVPNVTQVCSFKGRLAQPRAREIFDSLLDGDEE